MLKNLGSMGYKTQSQALNHFHDDYGLKTGDGEEPEEETNDESLSEHEYTEGSDKEMED
jgi:hypothetical protein